MAERDFKLPDLGEGLTEGDIVRWLVKEGDQVALNQPLVEVETAKAVVEIPSPWAGVVTRVHAAEGQTVAVGTPIVSIQTAADANGGPAPVAEEQQATLVGPGERPRQRRRRAAAAPPVHGPATQAPTRPKATPPVRRYAKDRGIDLAAITGTGKDGRVTREDVERALAARAAEAPAAPAPARRRPRERTEERIRVSTTRRQIAAHLVAAKATIPHVTEFLTVDATALMALRERLRALPAAQGVKLTPLAIVAKAVCAAVQEYPFMNASWDEEAGEIVVKGYVNLGIATDTESGLLVPNIKDADTLGIIDLAREISRVSQLARERRATPADLTGGTITITNVGGFGVEAGTPIINKPECAIVSTGAVAPRPWVVDGALAVRSLMPMSVSFDHRIVDGAYAARFLCHLRDLLEDPALLAA